MPDTIGTPTMMEVPPSGAPFSRSTNPKRLPVSVCQAIADPTVHELTPAHANFDEGIMVQFPNKPIKLRWPCRKTKGDSCRFSRLPFAREHDWVSYKATVLVTEKQVVREDWSFHNFQRLRDVKFFSITSNNASFGDL